MSAMRFRITRLFPRLDYASVDPHALPCDIACGLRRYTRAVALAYYPPRRLACTWPVEVYPREKI